MPLWIFYSSKTGNTARLLHEAGLPGIRIPRSAEDGMPTIDQPFVLVTPSYGDGEGKGAIPKAVARFLSQPQHTQWLAGIVGCGDPSYGPRFAQAGSLISHAYQAPLLRQVAHFGSIQDHEKLREFHANFQRGLPMAMPEYPVISNIA